MSLRDDAMKLLEREAPAELPLMARREWMPAGLNYAGVDPNGRWAFLVGYSGDLLQGCRWFRITDTDEYGLPVIPREPGIREGSVYTNAEQNAWCQTWQPWMTADKGWKRIEDFNPVDSNREID